MSDERRDDLPAPLQAAFARDPGAAPSELIAARLMLKRALAREHEEGGANHVVALHPWTRLERRPWFANVQQAAGFVLILALLVPVVPRLNATRGSERGARAPDLVASLADEARAVEARLKPWLPSLPSSGLLDWLPSLHSDAR